MGTFDLQGTSNSGLGQHPAGTFLLGKQPGTPCRWLGIGYQMGTFRTHRLTLDLPTG
jgi:hypothetical protein